MKISYDIAVHMAADMIAEGKVKPDIKQLDSLKEPSLLLSFHAVIPISELEKFKDEEGESNE